MGDVTDQATGDNDQAEPTTLTAEQAQLASQLITGDETFDEDNGAHSSLVDKLDTIAAGE